MILFNGWSGWQPIVEDKVSYNFDGKTGTLIVRIILFNCALFVLLGGIGAAFFLQPDENSSGTGLDYLEVVTAIFSPIALVSVIVGKGYLARSMESRSGESKVQVFVGGTVTLMAICEAPGLLWALCAYLASQPYYAIGSLVHALAILVLWPDGSELEEEFGTMASEGVEE